MHEKSTNKREIKYPLSLPPEVTLWVNKMHVTFYPEWPFNIINIFPCKKYHLILFCKYIVVYCIDVIIYLVYYGTFTSKSAIV